MDAARIESLHETASSRFLQGDIEGALTAWREVLVADPRDDRAIDGVRLCEQLAGSQSESVCTSGHSPFAVGTSRPDELPDLPPIPPGPRGVEPEPERPLDLSDLAGHEPPPPRLLAGWDFGEEQAAPLEAPPRVTPPPPPPVGPVAQAASPALAGPAEVELRRRVNELIAEALRAVEHGDAAAAARTIGRILILDEDNETALSLRAKLELGHAAFTPPTPQVKSPPPIHAEPFGHRTDALELGGAGASLDLDRPLGYVPDTCTRPVAKPQALPAFESSNDLEPRSAPGPPVLEDLPPLESLLGEPEPLGFPSGPAVARSRGPRGRVVKIALASLAAVLFAAVLWWFVGSDGEAPPESSAPGLRPAPDASGPTPDGEVPPTQAAALSNSAPGGLPAPTRPSAPAGPFETALARADKAESAGDLGATVLALAEALKARPDADALRERLAATGARYKVKQERDKKWQEAVTAFEAGSYSAALAYFYRVPADDPRPELERYKLNGWYNLGLLALRSGDCKSAKEHLREARQVSATDPGVKEAYELAHRCAVTRDPSWVRGVQGLEIRAFDD